MPYVVVTPVHVEINDVPLSTPAWECLNPMELRQGPPTRGRDRLIPGAAGVLPGRRRPAPATHVLELVVRGDVDWEGTPYEDGHEGCDANLAHLREFVTDPLGDNRDGSPLDAALHLPDGTTAVAQVHVESFRWSYWGVDAQAAMTVTVLSGSFEGGGS